MVDSSRGGVRPPPSPTVPRIPAGPSSRGVVGNTVGSTHSDDIYALAWAADQRLLLEDSTVLLQE